MDPELRRRFAKLESANKRVSIENRRLAREVIDLEARLEKLETSVPEAVKLAKARDRTVTRLHGAVVKVVRAIGKVEARLAKLRPGPAAAKRRKATGARLR
jgi:phage shock protein A